ncbi:hypothetical protein F5050DRAFT_1874365 [Lentinula boryana]|uniref:Uncharacterized protein n=1 Tax=Lentinula boryana TaxID=40481 RepID=A0ABQ8PXB4_9AGAR|nr:hypothetical protein F5050DRAFT_1874365 [Lentinula boryana]
MPTFGVNSDCSNSYHAFDTLEHFERDYDPTGRHIHISRPVSPVVPEPTAVFTRVGRSSNPSSHASPALVITIITAPELESDPESEPEPITAPEPELIPETTPETRQNPNSEMTHNFSLQDLGNMIGQLAHNQTQLQSVVSSMVGNISTNKGVSKPQPHNGKRTAFELWANGVQTLQTNEGERIKSAISFLEGDAAIWATPISKNISQVANGLADALIYPTWLSFTEARFETVNPVVDAKDALKGLFQGRTMVATSAASFKQCYEYASGLLYGVSGDRKRLVHFIFLQFDLKPYDAFD